MKVFIGWSEERSQGLAEALREWIPLVLHYAEPWLSKEDVAAGERWAESLAKELEASNFGIICVTRENHTSPWILFEAGSLAKSLQGGRVIPLLLDLELSEISGPLAQFQAKKVEKDGIKEVIESINKAAAQPIQEARVKQLFDALWPQLEQKLASIPKQVAKAKPIRPQHEILEELVAGVRSLESRLRDVQDMVSTEASGSDHFRRLSRLHPFMFSELAHMTAEKPGDPIVVLLAASIFREQIPWLYELGMEAYRVAKAGGSEEAESALRRFQRAAEFAIRGPLQEELGLDSRALHMMTRELEHFFPEAGLPEGEPKTKPKRMKEPK
jgi:hypothetical protein